MIERNVNCQDSENAWTELFRRADFPISTLKSVDIKWEIGNWDRVFHCSSSLYLEICHRPHSGVARGHILLSSSSGCIRQRILLDYPYTGNLRYDYCYHEDTKLRWGGLQIAAREQYAQILVNRILALCKSRGISVNKLSEMSGVSQSTLDNLVNGKTFNPRICTLHRIALAFGMTVSEFLNFKDLNDFSFEDILDD